MEKKPMFWESLGVPTLAAPISNSRQSLGTLYQWLRSVSIARIFWIRVVASSHRGSLGVILRPRWPLRIMLNSRGIF